MRREERQIQRDAEEKLAFFGERLAGYRWDQPAYSLSYANRRRLEIARATATHPRLLLLDEPAAGMNPVETHEITELIAKLREEGGYTILVIEHDMHVVEGISDRVVALDHGIKIAEGTFEAVATNPLVVEAYLGTGGRRARERGDRIAPAPPPSLAGVDTFYGPIHILRDVTLEIGDGELVCLLGGNASGKSTTLKTILGIVRPRAGTVSLDGRDVTRAATAHRIKRGLAIVPENRRLFAPLTRRGEPRARGIPRGRADLTEDFERVYSLFPRVYECRKQLAGTLSGGEQQMVAMGRALMSRPKLLLMDEPSMGLAPVLVARTFEIIQQVHESGVAMLVVEQNANVSLSIADRGYVLSTGRVVLEGKASELLAARRAAEGIPRSMTGVGSDVRERLPHLRAYDLRQLVLAGRALRRRPRGLRRLSRRLGRARRGMGALGRARGAARAAFARLVGAGPDEVAVTTSVSQGVSGVVSALPLERGERRRIVITELEFPTVGQIAHAQELRGAEVVHVRPGDGRDDPARALRGGDRRAHGARLLHRRLLPDRVAA